MLDENLLLCKKEPVIMFVLKHNRNLGSYPIVGSTFVYIFEYTYTDPSTKQTVTKSVKVNSTNISTNTEYVFPCAIGDTVTFSNLIVTEPSISEGGARTSFCHGVDVSPTAVYNYVNSFSVTVSGSSPYIEYYYHQD